jgi:hypothetical protein
VNERTGATRDAAARDVRDRTELRYPTSLLKKFSFWRGFFLHRELFSVFCMLQTRSR